MSRNGSGTYSLPSGNPFVTGTTISSTTMNSTMSDIATALTNSLAANGETPVTANIPMNSHKITGLAAPTTAGDALAYGSNLTVANSNDAGPTVLDWYLEGTFTPALKFGGASVGMTYSTQSGRFTRIGNVVTFWIEILLSAKGSSTGSATITGLPYTANGSVVTFFPCTAWIPNSSIGSGNVAKASITYNTSTVNLNYANSTGDNNNITDTLLTGTQEICVSGSYMA